MWDKLLTPSIYHGVTTMIAGNCGFTLAPLFGCQDNAEYLIGMPPMSKACRSYRCKQP